MRNKLNLALVAAVTFTITYYSISRPVAGPVSGGSSLLLHGLAYFGLAAALLVYFHDTEVGHIEAIAFAVIIGFSIEIVQYFLPYRHFSVIDGLTNLFGASLVMLDHRIDAVTHIISFEDRLVETVESR